MKLNFVQNVGRYDVTLIGSTFKDYLNLRGLDFHVTWDIKWILGKSPIVLSDMQLVLVDMFFLFEKKHVIFGSTGGLSWFKSFFAFVK